VDRGVVPEVLSNILAQNAVEDISVEDPPLEEVIAEMFSLAATAAQRPGPADRLLSGDEK
jgi:ABC-2 type transport system ATP-binding protein